MSSYTSFSQADFKKNPHNTLYVNQSLSLYQQGFTLLEMVLVLFLMGLIASATFMLTENVEDQAKYDETKRRLDIMRKAIVGNPGRTLNGGPEISGFVADMGRLPACLRELLEMNDCNGSALPAWPSTPDVSTGLFFGWHGPYIQVLPERDGTLRFRDGYGNTDTSDAQNSGWQWQVLDSVNASDAEIHVKSAGIDGVFGNADNYPSGAISAIPALVTESQHLVNSLLLSGRVRFLDLSTAIPATSLVLRLHYPDGGGSTLSVDSDTFTIDASTATINSGFSPLVTFSNGTMIPMGVRTFEVLCTDDTVFNGSCPGNGTHDTFERIVISPRSQSTPFTILWDLP